MTTMKPLTVYVDRELSQAIDRARSEDRASRAAFIRTLVAKALTAAGHLRTANAE